MEAEGARGLVGRLRHSWLENQVLNKSEDDVVALWREGPWNALEQDFPAYLARARALTPHLTSAYSPARWVELSPLRAALPAGERERMAGALDEMYAARGGLGDLPERIDECLSAVDRALVVVISRWRDARVPEGRQIVAAGWTAFREDARRLHGLLRELPDRPWMP